ncbi:Site-specific recombinase XerD [Sporobacter termitidis DSM 10068]|uniref:Site-specific recombinase XerD n=1 Tax=Sporobacter termitidis DSM 10068 TaxID=1123282 RepID=A0A1M5Y373_9FIRM|nr:site-specific integrase [Sporobacter termitidis]SHI06511.1 Site-specific recombinase XerD [Sporobacter termitidis DSM 10068]
MSRRGENVYRRKDGRWEGRILKPDGKYKYLYAGTYREIKEKKKNYQDNAGADKPAAPRRAENPAGLFDRWLESCAVNGVKPSTYENYYNCMRLYVIPFFTGPENSRITETSAGRFVRAIKDNVALSDAYKRKLLSIFKTALREILKGSAECAPVMEAVRLPKPESTEVQVFSLKEQRLVENAVLCSNDMRRLGILLCFYTGIRLGELCALKWGDIDFEAGTMSIARTVSRTKNFRPEENRTALLVGLPKSQKSVRKIPLPAFLLKLAAGMKPAANEEHYVLSGTAAPLDPRTYQKYFKKILLLAGVKDRKFHAIRHTFATRALELGVDIKTLSEILGHANVSITLNIYAHSLMEQKKIAIEKLNKLHITHMDFSLFPVTEAVIPV